MTVQDSIEKLIITPKTSDHPNQKFLRCFFQKATEVEGEKPSSLTAVGEIPMRSAKSGREFERSSKGNPIKGFPAKHKSNFIHYKGDNNK